MTHIAARPAAARLAPEAAPDDQTDILDPAGFAPPAAPMAMPKQVLERAPEARTSGRGFRLPLFGGRVQGQR